MVEGRGGRSHVVNEIQEHTDGVPPSCVSRPGCSSTSFQSESHPVPRGPTDPPGSIIKRQGRNIINNREQTDNTAALRRRLKRSGQRSAISPLPHNRDQGPLNKSRCLCPRTQRTNRRRDRRRGWTRTLLARDELDGWSGPRLRHFLIEEGPPCRSPDVDVSLRMTVDEDKQLYRGPDPRQSLVENPWKRNRNTAVVRWINTNPEPRPRPPTLKTPQQTQQIAVKW